MKTNSKSIAVTFSFVFILLGFMLANIIMPDQDLTYSERRRLASAPEFSWESLFSGTLFEAFDKYALDQFVFREAFREIKAIGSYYLFRHKDNNDLYIVGNHISKMAYPLNEKAVKNAADKLNQVYSRYLQGKSVNYAVIPDKNYFLANQNGYLAMDYDKMMEILRAGTEDMNYIDLFESLSIEDYYRTDIHWRQERLVGVADKLLQGMGNDARIVDMQFESNELHPFHGSLFGQAALKIQPDTLVYLTNDQMVNYIVYDYETNSNIDVYLLEKFEGMDPYDVFLSGAKSLLKIINPKADTDRKLLLFRDSFGSSIAPLLMAGYSEITLIDLRYITAEILDRYIDFSEEQDVLFLYNTEILNRGYLLK
jgi:hypothetical protein